MNKSIDSLYKSIFGNSPYIVENLPPSGSHRKYYRLIINENESIIAVSNDDYRENKAFIEFSNHFISKGISVPKILAEDLENGVYLQEDLGKDDLLYYIEKDNWDFSEELISLYKKVIDNLVKIQIVGNEGIDYSYSFPREKFDRQSILWDLNYFKYSWCRLANIPFDEDLLEKDFTFLLDYVSEDDMKYFMFRDFQSRNILIHKGEPFFIDFQGGRKGALQYDIASLLFDAIAEIPENIRESLLSYYISSLNKYIEFDNDRFIKSYYAYSLIRLLQAMGAFGLRGLYEKKQHFIDSIKPGLSNLMYIFKKIDKDLYLPELYKTIENSYNKY